MKELLETFDTIAYLESRGIDYWTHGKNVTPGWTNVACPFCGDHSNHLGISPQRFFSCWRCKKKGPVTMLIMVLDNCPRAQANTILQQYQTVELAKAEPKLRRRKTISLMLPPEATPLLPTRHREYLKARRFDPELLIKKYKLMATDTLGDYKLRIIAPIIMNGNIVNFTSRDITGLAEARYKHCPNNRAIVPMEKCIYNIDSVGDTVIVTEGITDVWRIGDGAVATLGVEFTNGQLNMLVDKGVKKAFVMFDSGASAMANKIAQQINSFRIKTEIIDLSKGDPANLSVQQIKKLRRELFT